MTDHLSKAGRSRNMASIKSRDTKPELLLRSTLRQLGASGYRLHRKDIPGKPDIAYIRWRVAVFVDGGFWHGHPDHWNPNNASSDYWREKIARNQRRDIAVNLELAEREWDVVRLWDHDVTSSPDQCANQVLDVLKARGWPGTDKLTGDTTKQWRRMSVR